MKTWQIILFSLLAGALITGAILLVALPPRGEAIQLVPQPTTPPLVVDVTGAVLQPGVYTLPAGSRVKDAIQSAGGLAPGADENAVNLAALLSDGQHLVIHQVGEATQSSGAPAGGEQSGGTAQPATPTPGFTAENPLNLNTATEADLETLPSIGPTRAQAIIAYREAHGAFTQVDDLLNVPGIGQILLERIKPMITVE